MGSLSRPYTLRFLLIVYDEFGPVALDQVASGWEYFCSSLFLLVSREWAFNDVVEVARLEE